MRGSRTWWFNYILTPMVCDLLIKIIFIYNLLQRLGFASTYLHWPVSDTV